MSLLTANSPAFGSELLSSTKNFSTRVLGFQEFDRIEFAFAERCPIARESYRGTDF